MSIVIVGAGHCGGRVAQGLRRAGYHGAITLIGSETYPPYERPHLSKTALTTDWDILSAVVLSASQCEALAIEWRAGCTVTSIDTGNQTVALDEGAEIPFDVLVLTTGGTPITMDVPNAGLPGIHLLRSIDRSQAIAAGLQEGKRVVVIGAGFIGLEVAASANLKGCDVTVLEAADRVLGRSLPQETAQAVSDLHQRNGVGIRLQTTVTAFEGTGHVDRVVLDDGERIDADMVVIDIGIRPDTAVAEAAGLACHDGIVTDAFGQTSHPAIWAAGDCACSVNARYDRAFRLETWQNAEQQAEIIARALTDNPVPNDAVPWLWSDQYDYTLQTIGFPTQGTRVVSRREGAVHLDLVYNGDTLVGAAGLAPGLKITKDIRTVQSMLEAGVSPDPDSVSDQGVKLKALLKS